MVWGKARHEQILKAPQVILLYFQPVVLKLQLHPNHQDNDLEHTAGLHTQTLLIQ